MLKVNKHNTVLGNNALAPEYTPYENKKTNKQDLLKLKKQKHYEIKKKLKTIKNILLVFCVGVVIVGRYGKIYNMQKECNNIKHDIFEIQRDSENLKVELVKFNNLGIIEKSAMGQLHMVEPTKEQIVYANLSYDNFKKTNDSYIYKNNKNKGLIQFLSKIKEMLF